MADTMRSQSIIFQCSDQVFDYQTYIKSGGSTIGCGSQTEGIIFFISFYIMVPLIFLNLFIAIILEGFETTNQAMSTLI